MPLRKLPEKSAATVAMGKMRMSREARRAALLAREEKEKIEMMQWAKVC